MTQQQPATPAKKSEGMIAIEQLQKTVDELRADVTIFSTMIADLANEAIKTHEALTAVIEHLNKTPAPIAPTTPSGITEESIDVVKVAHGFSNNKHVYRVFGGRFMKFGVPLYPEAGIDLDAVPMGDNPIGNLPTFPKRVVIQLREVTNEETGEKQMQARRVSRKA